MELEFSDAVSTTPLDPSQRVRELRRTTKGRAELYARGKYVHDGGKGAKRVPATNRRFVAWDGEGQTLTTERIRPVPGLEDVERIRSDHCYILFGNSDGNYLQRSNLSTYDCLSLISATADPDAIHFGFAFTYDANMMLKDLPRKHLKRLTEKNSVRWQHFRIEYIPRKWFMITDYKNDRKTVKIWDVWSFFMCSFVKACEQYGIVLDDIVIEGKKQRDSFGDWRPELIRKYWAHENEQAVNLMEKFRATLYGAGLYITSWHGPGAIASYSLAEHKISESKHESPEPVYNAAQYAYAGGRFELFKVGRANRTVYQYDINSAYPHAISQLPNLAKGDWVHTQAPSGVARFGVYRIRFRHNPYESDLRLPMPFVFRSENGAISYPSIVDTWVWSPELAAARAANVPNIEVLEAWEFHEDDPSDKPFAFIAENYQLRRQWKAEGNPSQLALKLQMNSIYGKLAQRVGWNEEKRTAPKWHQLDWAGWITSYTRAKLFIAMLQAGTDLVSVETDAVFSTKRLRLDMGSELGQWEETEYDDIVYLQSGCYFALENGEWKEKYRGFDPGSLNVNAALGALAKEPENWTVSGTTTRFIGFRQALAQDFSQYRKWESDKDRELRVGRDGKRKHIAAHCASCQSGYRADQSLHDLSISNPFGGMSSKHSIPWLDEDLDSLQELKDEIRWEI